MRGSLSFITAGIGKIEAPYPDNRMGIAVNGLACMEIHAEENGEYSRCLVHLVIPDIHALLLSMACQRSVYPVTALLAAVIQLPFFRCHSLP